MSKIVLFFLVLVSQFVSAHELSKNLIEKENTKEIKLIEFEQYWAGYQNKSREAIQEFKETGAMDISFNFKTLVKDGKLPPVVSIGTSLPIGTSLDKKSLLKQKDANKCISSKSCVFFIEKHARSICVNAKEVERYGESCKELSWEDYLHKDMADSGIPYEMKEEFKDSEFYKKGELAGSATVIRNFAELTSDYKGMLDYLILHDKGLIGSKDDVLKLKKSESIRELNQK